MNRIICLILSLVAGISGIVTAFSFMDFLIPHSAWQSFAFFTAIASTVTLILFPNGLAMFFNKAGAITVNLIICYSILFDGHWPAVLFVN